MTQDFFPSILPTSSHSWLPSPALSTRSHHPVLGPQWSCMLIKHSATELHPPAVACKQSYGVLAPAWPWEWVVRHQKVNEPPGRIPSHVCLGIVLAKQQIINLFTALWNCFTFKNNPKLHRVVLRRELCRWQCLATYLKVYTLLLGLNRFKPENQGVIQVWKYLNNKCVLEFL